MEIMGIIGGFTGEGVDLTFNAVPKDFYIHGPDTLYLTSRRMYIQVLGSAYQDKEDQ